MIVRVHLFAKVGILKENAKYFLIIFFSVVRHGVSEFIRYAYIVHPAVQAYAYDSFSGSDLVKGRCEFHLAFGVHHSVADVLAQLGEDLRGEHILAEYAEIALTAASLLDTERLLGVGD